MSQDLHASFDLTVLEMIEHSPVGAVPHTPTYRDALARLYASHQVYASADSKDGHVTARSLRDRPSFFADNLDALAKEQIQAAALEANAVIFERYLQSLPPSLRTKAESHRLAVVGRLVHHRKHHGEISPALIHDPLHSLVLVPGGGPHPGLPGNYLYGSLLELVLPAPPVSWSVQLHDLGDSVWSFDTASLPEAVEKLKESVASAPFHLTELAALGFRST